MEVRPWTEFRLQTTVDLSWKATQLRRLRLRVMPGLTRAIIASACTRPPRPLAVPPVQVVAPTTHQALTWMRRPYLICRGRGDGLVVLLLFPSVGWYEHPA